MMSMRRSMRMRHEEEYTCGSMMHMPEDEQGA
jgi:hypothetical protein